MFVRAYLRASTNQQDAERAKAYLQEFASQQGVTIASFYAENESGTKLDRPELKRLISDCQPGDVILIEQVDRLTRLNLEDWTALKATLASKQLKIVSPELPLSFTFLKPVADTDDFQHRMQIALTEMMLDMLSAIARKDYADRRRRADQGIAKAKAEGKFSGRPEDVALHAKIKSLLEKEHSYSDIQELLKCSRATIAKVARSLKEQ